ncbi:chymotrypsin-like elastase family member 2A isoform X1 [Bactrocera oleae]|uniref:chymotrypsin-like elastase family member 2A isoform X1 n=1 Tax=Bactrocera oleae TaxID=104688 RepID=UPI00387E2A6D
MFFLPRSLLLCLIIFVPIAAATTRSFNYQQFSAVGCGSRSSRREPRAATAADSAQETQQQVNRTARIISGAPTKDGQYPWQASLELLHPSMGFLGHWCGGVLIHPYWILSAAHCIHNDLFNLPIPLLWTVVLGDHNRLEESGYEQRVPVDKIILHKRYHNFRHDLALLKLSSPANLAKTSNIRVICLPFAFNEQSLSEINLPSSDEEIVAEGEPEDPLEPGLSGVPDLNDNFLRSVQKVRRNRNVTLPSMRELMNTKILSRLKQTDMQRHGRMLHSTHRRNDKLMKVQGNYREYEGSADSRKHYWTDGEELEDYKDLPYSDCVATGWGKSNVSSDLTNVLLKTRVPLHNSERCRAAYGSFVKIHRGHLCAGKLNGKGGTCVGDSGGPLQCRLSKSGPWLLAGITSFGSGCAMEGFPDVYVRISYYMKWIQDTIAKE